MNPEETTIDLRQEQGGSRINGVTAFLMIAFGLLIDAVQAFLGFIIIGVVLNYIVGFYAWLTFFVWLKLRGIPMWEGRVGIKILMWMLTAAGVEILTVGAAPGWTLFAAGIVITEYSSKVPIVGKIAEKHGK